MNDIPRKTKKLLRHYADIAYEAEQRRELQALSARFDEWKNGAIDCWELTEDIHRFHNGASRELYKKYNCGLIEFNVAYAIFTGLLDRGAGPSRAARPPGQTSGFLRRTALTMSHSPG